LTASNSEIFFEKNAPRGTKRKRCESEESDDTALSFETASLLCSDDDRTAVDPAVFRPDDIYSIPSHGNGKPGVLAISPVQIRAVPHSPGMKGVACNPFWYGFNSASGSKRRRGSHAVNRKALVDVFAKKIIGYNTSFILPEHDPKKTLVPLEPHDGIRGICVATFENDKRLEEIHGQVTNIVGVFNEVDANGKRIGNAPAVGRFLGREGVKYHPVARNIGYNMCTMMGMFNQVQRAMRGKQKKSPTRLASEETVSNEFLPLLVHGFRSDGRPSDIDIFQNQVLSDAARQGHTKVRPDLQATLKNLKYGPNLLVGEWKGLGHKSVHLDDFGKLVHQGIIAIREQQAKFSRANGDRRRFVSLFQMSGKHFNAYQLIEASPISFFLWQSAEIDLSMVTFTDLIVTIYKLRSIVLANGKQFDVPRNKKTRR